MGPGRASWMGIPQKLWRDKENCIALKEMEREHFRYLHAQDI